jgi:hypothetical protein
MPNMSETLEVSQPVRSREGRAKQLLNIMDMSVTPEVSQPVRSREVREEHWKNIADMSVTPEVSSRARSALCKLLNQPNRQDESAGALTTSSFGTSKPSFGATTTEVMDPAHSDQGDSPFVSAPVP